MIKNCNITDNAHEDNKNKQQQYIFFIITN